MPDHVQSHTDEPFGRRFVGREVELLRLEQMFATGGGLVTLVGPPGIGKTTLAMRFCQRRRAQGLPFFLIDATNLSDSDDLAMEVAIELDLDTATVRHLGLSIAELGGCVVLIDAVDHLVGHGAGIVERWLRDAERTMVLVTSREPMHVEGECVVEIAPMALPEQHVGTIAELEDSEAGQLFLAHASGYTPQDSDAGAIARIVRHVDGVPLAIILSAARSKVLSPTQMVERLERGQPLFGGARPGDAGADELSKAIARSWSVLSPAERTTLVGCSVFRSGFTLAAAEAIVPPPHEQPNLLDTLHSLVDKSLLRPTRVHQGGSIRFKPYEGIRTFALANATDTTAISEVDDRYGSYYAALVERLAVQLGHHAGLTHRQELESELDNILDALTRSLSVGGATSAYVTRIANALRVIVCGRSEPSASRDVELCATAFLDALASRDASSTTINGATARLTAAVYAAFERKDAARMAFHRALEATAPQDQLLTLCSMAKFAVANGCWEDARKHLDATFSLAKRTKSPSLRVRALALYGELQCAEKRWSEGQIAFAEAAELANELTNPQARAWVLLQASICGYQSGVGVTTELVQLTKTAMELHRACGDRYGEAVALTHCGVLAQADAPTDAEQYYRAAEAIAEEIGAYWVRGVAAAWLGYSLALREELEGAAAAFELSSLMCRHVGDPTLCLLETTLRAHLDLARGRAESATGDGNKSAGNWRGQAQKTWRHTRDVCDGATVGSGVSVRTNELEPLLALLEQALTEGAYLLAHDGSWFQVPDGKRISLNQAQRLQRLLAGLVSRHGTAAQSVVSIDELIAIAWPGESMDYQSGINRVHVALTTLRKRGLRDVLVREGDGYRLDSARSIVIGDR